MRRKHILATVLSHTAPALIQNIGLGRLLARLVIDVVAALVALTHVAVSRVGVLRKLINWLQLVTEGTLLLSQFW
jgi:hypothetical protein